MALIVFSDNSTDKEVEKLKKRKESLNNKITELHWQIAKYEKELSDISKKIKELQNK